MFISNFKTMRDYPKIKRIPVPGLRVRGKKYLTEDEIKELFADEIIIEEKIDGKTSYEDIGKYRIFYEDLTSKNTVHKHIIQYKKLPPNKRIAFDVWDKENKRFLRYEEKVEFLREYGYTCAPLLFKGKVERVEELLKFLGKPSAFGAERIEGIVVKNYEKELFGKVVDPLFEEAIDKQEASKLSPQKKLEVIKKDLFDL